MLNKVEVRTDQGAVLTLPLEGSLDGLYITDIEGLDPVKATIVSSSFANLDGAQYQSSRREDRNLVFKISLEPDYAYDSVRNLRKRLYNFFMPKSRVNLRFFMDGDSAVDISGRVETFVSPLFAQKPEVTISIICFDPDFYTPIPIVISQNSLDPMATSLPDYLFKYDGSVDTGVKFTLNVDKSVANMSISLRPASGLIQNLSFQAQLLAGDVLRISTIPGAKGATLTRGTTISSILYGISPYSDWLSLTPGDNYLRVLVAGSVMPYTLEYNDKFGGL